MLDTLEFARRMIEAGMPEQTAEALAHQLRDVLPESQAATKADLAEMRADFEKLRTDVEKLRTDFANLKVWVLLIVVIGQVIPVLRAWLHWP